MDAKTRKLMKKIAPLKIAAVSFRALKGKNNALKRAMELVSFFNDYWKYKRMPSGNFALKMEDLYPRLGDKTSSTPLDPVYFFQNAWCAGKIFASKPERHFDVGSDAKLVGIISQFTPTTMVDIRPLPVKLAGLDFVQGNITALPFQDGEIDSLSSICVIEHIGLGRYGDPLDPFGSEKAAKELKRVLASGGNLYVSLPVDSENKTYFNAHRAFTREYVLELFAPLELIEEKYVYGKEVSEKYDSEKGFGTGLFHFKKT